MIKIIFASHSPLDYNCGQNEIKTELPHDQDDTPCRGQEEPFGNNQGC